MQQDINAIVIAGTHSGVGKTSVAVGLMAALTRRGLKVQPFKVGPDFLDPMHHHAACGVTSINLDGWMMGKEHTTSAFQHFVKQADVAVIEGVMGLYDGRDGASETGSTAEVAKWVGAPVVLVVDCWAMARSVGAMVKGYRDFDPAVNVAAVVFNKVGGPAHVAWLQQAVSPDIVVLGGLPKTAAVEVQDRHLGLRTPHKGDAGRQHIAALADLVEAHLDMDKLIALAATCTTARAGCSSSSGGDGSGQVPRPIGHAGEGSKVRIAVARDEAFCFYYAENFTHLEAAGAEIVFFSPLHDAALPPGTAGLYFGGGYPELHAARLAANSAMLAAVAAFASAGGVVYAECGGLMYLSRGIRVKGDDGRDSKTNGVGDSTNKRDSGWDGSSSGGSTLHACVGVLPFSTSMVKGKMSMGYVEVTTLAGCNLFPDGITVRGQVYHFSEIESDIPPPSPSLLPSPSPAAPTILTSRQSQQKVEAPPRPTAAAGLGAAGKADACNVSPDGSNAPAAAACARVANGGGEGAQNSLESNPAPGTTSDGRLPCAHAAASPPSDCHDSPDVLQQQQQQQQVRHGYSCTLQTPGALPSLEGYMVRNVLATYVHLHFGSAPGFAAHLVACCRRIGVPSSVPPAASPCGEAGGTSPAAFPQTDGTGGTLGLAATPQTDTDFVTTSTSPAASASDGTGGTGAAAILQTGGTEGAVAMPQTYGAVGTGPAATPQAGRTGGTDAASAVDTIVSLSPAATEIVMALGLGSRLVGVTDLCDHPPHVRLGRAIIAASRIDTATLSSAEVEAQMQRMLAEQTSRRDASRDNALGVPHRAPAAAEVVEVVQAGNDGGCQSSAAAAAVAGVKCATSAAAEVGEQDDDGEGMFVIATSWLSRNMPGVVLTQGTCDKCDPSHMAVERAVQLAGRSVAATAGSSDAVATFQAPRIVVQDCRTVEDILRFIEQVGDVCDAAPAAQRLVHSLRARLARVAGLVVAAPRPVVVSLEGLDPLVLGGHWLPDVKQRAGGVDPHHAPGCAAERVTWARIVDLQPEVLLLCPCSRSVTATLQEVNALAGRPGWDTLPAVLAGRVYVVDHGAFSRPGPRVVQAVETLARILHPELVADLIPEGLVRKLCCDAARGNGACGGTREGGSIEKHFEPYR